MILQDHLDNENMEVKCVQLEKYLLDYLNDSARKLSSILTKDKLEKTDVESLNSCVCMFESANDTFSLQSHISIKSISETFENFLSKISSHVEEIIQKMNMLLENKNSFHVLEQYMEELDLIRTISIIEVKTIQSYFSMLEKLVGYVRTSRSIVDEELRILFRQKEKVDYDKLTTCLISLKEAKWIEKYRSGVYSDAINDVEQKLTQHVETSKETVMQINLDLDNFDKIEQVCKIISDMNNMESLTKIVPNIGEYITTVNCWFKRVVNNVFVIITETFSL
jgi:flagellar biosynthesis chaperone FliJ